MLFPKHLDVNATWSKLAPSVASGPLRAAGVFLAKVSTAPLRPDPSVPVPLGHTHVICLYLADIYDLAAVRRVLEVLLTQHGLEPSAAKADLYTLAGIDSGHRTKLRSSVWRPAEVVPGGRDEVKVG
jgi:hypothetical protein